jgi:Protein of unknown function (DUF3892)
MVYRLQIRCINKSDRSSPYERIRNVGGTFSDGSRWKQSQEQTIREIEAKEYEYFVSEGGKAADVIVASHDGHKYIKTTADGLHPNNLLSLPKCP